MHQLIESQWDNEQDTEVRPEMDEEEIVQADVVYHIKKKDDTTSQPVIFVDEIHDTIDISRNIITPDM